MHPTRRRPIRSGAVHGSQAIPPLLRHPARDDRVRPQFSVSRRGGGPDQDRLCGSSMRAGARAASKCTAAIASPRVAHVSPCMPGAIKADSRDNYSWDSYTPDIRNRDSRSRSGRSRSDSRRNTGDCTKIRLQSRHNRDPSQCLDIAPSPGSMETPALPAMGDTLGPESEEED